MLREVNIAQEYILNKFGSVDEVKSGTYAVPMKTSKGDAYMKVVIDENLGMSDFHLFNDEKLTISWY